MDHWCSALKQLASSLRNIRAPGIILLYNRRFQKDLYVLYKLWPMCQFPPMDLWITKWITELERQNETESRPRSEAGRLSVVVQAVSVCSSHLQCGPTLPACSPACTHAYISRKQDNIYTMHNISVQESPANAKGTRDSSACMKAHCEQM